MWQTIMTKIYVYKNHAADYEGKCLAQCINAEATPAMRSIILPFVCIILIHNPDDSDENIFCF